ncbi:hydantoinase B/oxoprolinase family protein [Thiobacter aerophilum]|uniref:Hydantoinase B/oxoprolinase family protein n=1 Tax=Thiobacter aerophilum TaxID=3121275 RepID=A0ABV0ECT2_9BURK
MQSGRWEFWIDRGGTFTDIVARRPDGTLVTHKLLSENPRQYRDAALAGIRQLMGLTPDAPLPQEAIGALKMGTTLGTNALLTRRGARVALVITAGFGDALIIGDQSRPDIFALRIERPAPLFERVIEARERVAASGEVVVPLDEAQLADELKEARAAGIEAVAIVFAHGYRHPAHEARAARIARALGFCHVAVSHEVSPVIKLVARGDTTLVDAYLTPVLAHYVASIRTALPKTQVLFMQSHGGLVQAEAFRGRDCLLSGPAGGIAGAVKTAAQAGLAKLITFDMGGTSTDVAHYDGQLERGFETEVAGYRVRVPMLAIHTVAAGGGSILHFDGRRLLVGPDSAGGKPGPACYRNGGPLTVTDANLFLGRLQARYFPRVFGPDGDGPLDEDVVRRGFAALAERVSASGTTRNPEAVAEGFLAVAVENMAQAIRRITLERGHDPAEYTLCCFGGAGGQLVCRVADALGMTRVFLHPLAGVLSAYGMGLADQRLVLERAVEVKLEEAILPELGNTIATLAQRGRDALAEQGVQAVRILSEAQLALKYAGTDTTLPVAWGTLSAMRAAFEAAYRRLFGFVETDAPIQVEAVRVEVVGEVPPPALAVAAPAGNGRAHANARLYTDGRWQTVPLYSREDLCAGQHIAGPALLIEPTSTLVIEAGWQVAVGMGGELMLTRVASRQDGGGAPALSGPDPVALELFNRRFMAIAEEMGVALKQTAHSVNIKERLDFSCAIFNRRGELIANAPHIPVHLGSMGDAVCAVRERFATSMRPGQVFLINSPYHGGTHLPDITVVTPVWDDEGREVWFYTASRGHHADVGGITPGSMPPTSRRIEEEGVWTPGLTIVADGRFLEEDVRAWLTGASYPARDPAQNLADLKAQIAANEKGAQKLRALVARHGLEMVEAYMEHTLDLGEAAVREAIAGLNCGRFELMMDSGARIVVSITIDRARGEAMIDFTGTSRQQPDNFNAPASIVRAAVLYVFRTLVRRAIPLNAGCLRPLTLRIPAGSLLDPRPPAAVVAGNVETSQAIVDALLSALGVLAASQGTMNNLSFGDDKRQYYETICGGAGAGPDFDGAHAVQTHMTNSRMTDLEVLENRFPVRVETFAIRRGSGGVGRNRGGDGVLRRIRFLAPMQAAILSQRRGIPPFGLAGGGAGRVGENRLIRADGQVVTLAACAEVSVAAGDCLEIATPGGGGYGLCAGE